LLKLLRVCKLLQVRIHDRLSLVTQIVRYRTILQGRTILHSKAISHSKIILWFSARLRRNWFFGQQRLLTSAQISLFKSRSDLPLGLQVISCLRIQRSLHISLIARGFDDLMDFRVMVDAVLDGKGQLKKWIFKNKISFNLVTESHFSRDGANPKISSRRVWSRVSRVWREERSVDSSMPVMIEERWIMRSMTGGPRVSDG
jgi:hypothetical protein